MRTQIPDPSKPSGRLLTLATIVAVSTAMIACDVLGAVASMPTPTSTPTSTATATSAPTATGTPTPLPTESPPGAPSKRGGPGVDTPESSVSTDEAELTVRQFFDAIANERFDRIRAMTTGQARDQVDLLIRRLQDAERERNVRVNLAVSRIAITSRLVQQPWTRVGTEFRVDARVPIGPISMTVESIQGKADFFVRRINGQPMIERIEGDLR